MRAQAVAAVALRGPGKALMCVAAVGWIATALLLNDSNHARAVIAHAHADVTAHAAGSTWSGSAIVWAAMILAMAPPLLLREVGVLWRTTLRRVRVGALALFAVGYACVWLLAGLAILPAAEWAATSTTRIAAAIAFVIVWQCSPARQRTLNACHRVPHMPVFGTAARGAAFRYGVTTGLACTAACGPLMLLVLLFSEHHLAAMALAAAAATVERHVPPKRPRWRLPLVARKVPDWPAGDPGGYPAGVSR